MSRLPRLASSSHGLGLVRRVPKWLAVLALVVSACDPPVGMRDAGLDAEAPDGSVGGASASVRIPGEPIEAGDATLRAFSLHVASLRLVSDRGADLDPVRTDIGPLDLTAANTLPFDAVPPASYSAAVLVLDGAATQLDLTLDDVVLGVVHISYDSRLQWMARCPSGVPLRVGETLRLQIRLDVGPALEELREGPLPAPSGGVITVNATTAPLALHEFVERLGESVLAECERE